jgi:hypothetical protein
MARGAWRNKDTYSSIAINILKEKNGIMDFDDICEEILKRRKKKHAKTPKKSIYSALWGCKEISIPKRGLVGLKEWE